MFSARRWSSFAKRTIRSSASPPPCPRGTGLKALEKAMPKRYYDVGIAEEHAVLFAAGMATMGFHPVCAIYSTFLQRAYDCIVHDVALQDLPVIFCMDRAGLSANDGPTHHGLFDIAYLRCVPNIICHGAAQRGRTGGHDVHGHASEASGVHPLSARRRRRRAGQGPAGPAGNRQGGSDAQFCRHRRAQGGAVRPGQHAPAGGAGGGAVDWRRVSIAR